MSRLPAANPHFTRPPASGDIPEVLPASEVLDVLPVVGSQATPIWTEEPVGSAAEPRPGLIVRTWRGICSVSEWLFGMATLILGLAVLAAIPVLQFLSLGYLLEAGGRIARTGRFRDGFPGVRKAARVGSIVLGTYVLLLPLRLLSSLSVSAQLVDPDGPIAFRYRLALEVATVLIVTHIVAAVFRGGKLRYFVWPFNIFWLIRRIWKGGYYAKARDAVWDFVTSLRLPYYFWLGFRGFVGAFIWLALPVTLLALAVKKEVPLVGFLGSFLLMIVLLYVPFLQIRLAAQNRFRAMFELGAIRELFKRAPWCFALALFVTLLFALPLYLLKIEMIPREAAWLPSLFFILFIFPARLLTGWAVGIAEHRPNRAHWFFRWTGRLPLLPMTGIYVFFLFFTQYAAWQGVLSLYEQHAFLLPVPFMGM